MDKLKARIVRQPPPARKSNFAQPNGYDPLEVLPNAPRMIIACIPKDSGGFDWAVDTFYLSPEYIMSFYDSAKKWVENHARTLAAAPAADATDTRGPATAGPAPALPATLPAARAAAPQRPRR